MEEKTLWGYKGKVCVVTGSSNGMGLATTRLLVQLGPEFEVLRKIPVEQISRTAGEQTGCLVDKLRKGKIKWNSGFDGEYGTIDPGVIQ